MEWGYCLLFYQAFTTPPITGHPAASPAATLKCLKSLSPLQLYCLFAYLLCYGASPVIHYVGFFRTVSNLFLLCLCLLMNISAQPGALSGIYTRPPLILKLTLTPDWSAENWKKKRPIPHFTISLLIFTVIGFLRNALSRPYDPLVYTRSGCPCRFSHFN